MFFYQGKLSNQSEFNKRNIEIKLAKDIIIRNQKLKTYLLQSGLGHIYVFCDQKFKIIGMTNGSSDFVDQDWETFLPVLKKEMLANEMAYNKAIEKEATIWGEQTYILNNAKVLDIKTGKLSGDTAIFIENKEEGIIKISLRSLGDFDVNQLSREHFSGGGHNNAAGGKSMFSMEETIKQFENVVKNHPKLKF